MIPFHFPRKWGVPGTAPVVPTPVTPLWSALDPASQNWNKDGPQIQPRFARIMVNQDTGPQFVKVTDVVS